MSEAGKTTKLSMSSCEIVNKDMKVIAFATRVGNLYHLEHCQKMQHLNTAVMSNEKLWHRRFGHVGKEN